MGDSKYIVESPDLVEKKTVDSNGRIYLGKAHAGNEVEIVVNILEEESNE